MIKHPKIKIKTGNAILRPWKHFNIGNTLFTLHAIYSFCNAINNMSYCVISRHDYFR